MKSLLDPNKRVYLPRHFRYSIFLRLFKARRDLLYFFKMIAFCRSNQAAAIKRTGTELPRTAQTARTHLRIGTVLGGFQSMGGRRRIRVRSGIESDLLEGQAVEKESFQPLKTSDTKSN